MRKFEKCDICSEYHWSNVDCAPEYMVYHEEQMGDEYRTIRAHSHENAALKYGELYNSDEYPLMDGSTIQLKVEKDDGVVELFEVGAEPDIHYTANKIDEIDKL